MGVSSLTRGLPAASAGFIEPMKCKLSTQLPEGSKWVYELKFDGVRALAIKSGRAVDLISRNKKNLDAKYPGVVRAVGGLKANSIVLDGEVVALDEYGRSSFQLLQNVGQPGQGEDLYYYVFDILHLNGKSTMGLPLEKRKELLQEMLKKESECLRFSGFLPGSAQTLQEKMSGLGLEGLIAKIKDSRYEPGVRSGAWVKFKWTNEQEFVLGGYTDPEGARKFFGSVLVGYYENGKLIYASKVGTGFDERKLRDLYARFQKLARKECPFANLPEPRGSRGQGLTASQMRFCHWVEPKLVCQVRFTEWTRDNHLRQPVFLGLREDKQPREVVRERATESEP
jgi:bifunctional non-homologous end joining protein LigD